MAKFAAVQEAVRQAGQNNLSLKRAILKKFEIIKSETSVKNGDAKKTKQASTLKKK